MTQAYGSVDVPAGGDTEICDECGAEIGDGEFVNDRHERSCSLHPDNVIDGYQRLVDKSVSLHPSGRQPEGCKRISCEPATPRTM